MAYRIIIEEPCQYETGVEHPGCDYLAHILCRKCGWVQGPHDCTVRRVLDPGSYDEVQWCKRHRSAMHDQRCDYALWKGYDGDPNNCDRIVVWQLDALAGGEQP